MPVRKKRPSASDVLRQEMQQPLVIPERNPSPEPSPIPMPTSNPTPTPTITTNMNSPTNDDAATIAQLKAAQEKEAKLQQQKFDAQTKELNEARATIVKLAAQGPLPLPPKVKAPPSSKQTHLTLP
jgi:hypothetical protein